MLGHCDWVANWLTQLLDKDTQYIVKIHTYVIGDYITEGLRYGVDGDGGTHNRVKWHGGMLNVEDIIRKKLGKRTGKTMIICKFYLDINQCSILILDAKGCVKRSMGNQIRKVVRNMIKKERQDIYLKELPFYPN
ncbi:ferric-chelate reductase protein [Rutstroemia sp. NJR-2017a WRK4]|nr:ferric-chelate reductase protein [Rutstroemia sp. NJR-2017a WRK4]